jgi:hypothetical protein
MCDLESYISKARHLGLRDLKKHNNVNFDCFPE